MAKAPPRDRRIPAKAIEEGWSVLDHLPFPVLEIRDDYSVARANPASEVVYGTTKGACFELTHSRDVPCNQVGEPCPKERATKAGSDVTVRHAHSSTDGSVHLYLVSAYPLETGGILEFHIPVEDTLGRDGLTGLYTRDFFDQLVARQRALLERMELPYSMVLLDIDHFKMINDTYGHGVGDKVLREFGTLLLGERRDGDSVGRYGGEEFCIFMPGCDASGAKAYASRLLAAIRAFGVEAAGETLKPRASIGVWSGPASAMAKVAIKAADDALYRAKRAGRDRIAFADDAK